MKKPKTVNRLCSKCKKHTEHKVTLAKRRGVNATNHLTRGSKKRQKLRGRGVGIGIGNSGRYSRPPLQKWKMTGKKSSKKVIFVYECKTCGRKHDSAKGIRAKKIELE